jgi:benzoate transport
MRIGQILAIAVCCFLNGLDGFDVLSVTFAAPGIKDQWHIPQSSVGIVISSGLAGMTIGSLLIGPLADKIGRRPQIMLSLVLMAAGMFGCAIVTSVEQLCILRIFTGLGLGAILAAVNAATAEFANRKNHDFAIGMMAIGYPLGGAVGGFAASMLLREHGWQSIFIFGGVVTLIAIPLVLLFLPEPAGWLAVSGKQNALDRANKTLRRLGQPEATDLGPPPEAKPSFSAFFKPDIAVTTVALIFIYGLHMACYYYALGWVPSLVKDLGFDPSTGTLVSVFLTGGGVVGGIVVGFLSARFGVIPVLIPWLIGTTIAVAIFGKVPADLTLLKASAASVGFLANGAVVGIYALMARAYPATLRAGGTGLIIGIGRLGATMGPLAAGYMLSANLGREITSVVLGALSLIAAIIPMFIRLRGSGKTEAAS